MMMTGEKTAAKMPGLALLAGGLATRLHPISASIPKSMVPVAGRPFIAHQLDLLRSQGIGEVVICAGHLGSQIQDYVGDGARYGLTVACSFDGDRLLGTGGALRKALPLLGDTFFVMYGDSYLHTDFGEIARFFSLQNKEGLMTVLRNDGQWDRSNVICRDGRIVRYDRHYEGGDMHHIDYGLSLFRKSAFAALPADGYCDLSDIFKALIARDELCAFEVAVRFYEIGTMKGLEETDAWLSSFRAPHRKDGSHERLH